jgi:hypothetical protein
VYLRSKIEVRRHGRALGRRRRRGSILTAVVACAATAAVLAAPASAADGAQTGGTSITETAPGSKAKLRKGLAVAPSGAPNRVINAIEAANKIVKGHDYCMGGGHARWKSKCYDCSGTVSYALHGARMLDSPMPSGAFTKWGKKGKGEWITVYANSGHMYAVIAGLRLDTSMTDGKGPGWSDEMRSSRGYKKRHFKEGY